MSDFRRALRRATDQAFARAREPQQLGLVIAGVPIIVEATHPQILALFTHALSHHRTTEPLAGLPRIRIWCDQDALRPAMPDDLRMRIVNRTVGRAGHPFDYDAVSSMITTVDPDTGDALVCLEDLAHVPQYERAAPLRAALGSVLRRHGHYLVHGAAVCDEHGAGVLIGGFGGAGKSTTALRCRLGGMGYLADDICALTPGPRPTLHNVYGTAKALWEDHDRYPELRGQLLDHDRGGFDKAVYAMGHSSGGTIVDTADLRVVMLVDRTSPPGTIGQASRASAAATIAASTTAFLAGTEADLLPTLARVMREVPVLSVAPGLDPEVAARTVRAALEWEEGDADA